MMPPNDAKAVISLTSWVGRIKTVGITIMTLCKHCPGFHIVLTLSESEFPNKEADLPVSLQVLQKAKKCEILWTPGNLRSYKKILFALDKYRTVPVISADDDCAYMFNYAEILYKYWVYNKRSIITINPSIHYNITFQHGPCTLYPPYAFGEEGLRLLNNKAIVNANHDDVYYGVLAFRRHIPIISIPCKIPYKFHHDYGALSKTRKIKCHQAIRIMLKEIQ